ncbi:hypothetical protein SAMN04487966_10669 [Micrococcus terreus]|uniref:Uncharacterized protein n=2 Tax=Micrococcus terreus TaxID=574650 RepID=A0A1I7MMJ9_9MICC|nr:hypothetical protein SAMN04487966_10669 [Micrococcus terreus]
MTGPSTRSNTAYGDQMDVYAVGDWIWVSLENLSSVAPLGMFLAVVVAYSSYRGTIRQKTTADNRSAWWNRVQWAMDAAMDDDDQRRGRRDDRG